MITLSNQIKYNTNHIIQTNKILVLMTLMINPHLVNQTSSKSEHNDIFTCCPSICGVLGVLIIVIRHIEFITPSPIFSHPIMNVAANNNNIYLSFIRKKGDASSKSLNLLLVLQMLALL
jgi:hypothetical protein